MSVPHSTILSCSRGVLANTDIGYCSPKQSQYSSSYAENNVKALNAKNEVHVVVYPKNESLPELNSNKFETLPLVNTRSEGSKANPYVQTEDFVTESTTQDEQSKGSFKTRSIDTANETLTNLNQIIKNKDMLIQALVLSLDIIQNNPLIINKYVIADENELALLIKYLTGADEVDIIKNDHECSCSVSKKYDIVNRIMISKDGELYNLKYSYPDVNKYLFDRKFSTKFVVPAVVYGK